MDVVFGSTGAFSKSSGTALTLTSPRGRGDDWLALHDFEKALDSTQVFGDKSKDTELTMAWRVFGDEMGIGKAIGRGDLPHLAALAQSGSVVLIPGDTAISTLHALLPEEGRLRLCGSKNPVLVLDRVAALWAPENTLEALLNRMAQGR